MLKLTYLSEEFSWLLLLVLEAVEDELLEEESLWSLLEESDVLKS